MYFINSLWESILLKQLAAVFYWCYIVYTYENFHIREYKYSLEIRKQNNLIWLITFLYLISNRYSFLQYSK